ncbi:unnamed protein product [Phytophthora lilii]|uniref:Unnamed protein product n=1 Tax=Phytophthora lilii TaxID=2077276 RepID=A0A9W6WSN9_9STRA|nr:unnamed protein product [Phytophthora lilii]
MRVNVKVHGLQFVMPCGGGSQSCRWLGLAVAQRYALVAPHGRCRTREDAHIKQGFFLPAAIIKSDGQVIRPEKRIAEVCKDNETLTVQLQQEVPVNEIGTPQFTAWTANAFFPSQKRVEISEHADTKAESKSNSSFSASAKPQHQASDDQIADADAKGDGTTSSVEELKQYAHAEMLQQINSGQFLSDMEVEAAFLYDWSRIRPEEIEKDPRERDLLQELLLSRFSELNAGYMHYAAGSSELTYGMNGAEFAHFLHECELAKLHDSNDQKIVEKAVLQSLRLDGLVAMNDRGTLSRVGFLHSLLRVVQAVTSTKGPFSEILDSVLKKQVLPTIVRLSSGPFRDHSHHDVQAKPKLLKLYAKYAQEHAPKPSIRKKPDNPESEDAAGSTPSASPPPVSSTWPLLLSAVGLKSMLYDCGMFCSGTPEEQEVLYNRAVEQSFSGMREVERAEDRMLVFSEFLEVTARVALAVLENENELPPRDAIKLALEAVRSLPLKQEPPKARK